MKIQTIFASVAMWAGAVSYAAVVSALPGGGGTSINPRDSSASSEDRRSLLRARLDPVFSYWGNSQSEELCDKKTISSTDETTTDASTSAMRQDCAKLIDAHNVLVGHHSFDTETPGVYKVATFQTCTLSMELRWNYTDAKRGTVWTDDLGNVDVITIVSHALSYHADKGTGLIAASGVVTCRKRVVHTDTEEAPLKWFLKHT